MCRPSSSAPLWLPWFVLLAGGPLAASAAQNYKLSGELPHVTHGAVGSFVQSAGGRTVFATSSGVTPSRLMSVPADGSSAPTLLRYANTPGTPIDFQVTADGAWTVFRAPTDRIHVYAIPTDGSASARELDDGLSYEDVVDFRLSSDSTRVVFRTDANTVFELYSRPIDASAPAIKLNGALVQGGDVTADYRISPDGRWVVYRADQTQNTVFDLYAVPIDGSAPARSLNLHRFLGDVQSDFVISHDSLGVVYRADQDADEVFELYAVRIDGSTAPVKRNGPLVAGGDVSSFALTANDARIVYLADEAQDRMVELFSVASSGGADVKLNPALVAGGNVRSFQLSRDGACVVYLANQDLSGVPELFTVPSNGGASAKKLHAALSGGHAVTLYRLSPDGAHVMFAADLATATARELYRAPLDASAPPQRLTTAFAAGHEVTSIVFDSRGEQVVYLSDEGTDGIVELYSVPADGSQSPVNLNRHMVTAGSVLATAVTDDDARVVYTARQRAADAVELFSVPITGTAGPTRLNDPFPTGAAAEDVESFQLGPDGRSVFYSTYQLSSGSANITDAFRVSLDGFEPPRRLNDLSGRESGPFISPDSRYYLFRRPSVPSVSLYQDLISVRADGRIPPVQLDGNLSVAPGWVSYIWSIAFTPDSSRVVFTSSKESGLSTGLYCVPIDGGQPALRLDTDVFASPQLAHDGSTVAYLRGSPNELFSVPIDSSRLPTRLSGPLPPGGQIGSFALSPDGTRAVYVADQDTDDVFELYSVPIDASAPPVKLSGAMVSGGDVRYDASSFKSPFVLSPDGARVVYIADQDTDEVFELYSTPIDGSAPPVKLSGPMVPGGDVGAPFGEGYDQKAAAISPDSRWVVYLADAATNGVTEIYSVRIDGSGSRVKLDTQLSPDADVYGFLIDPSSSLVVYRSLGPGLLPTLDILSVPIDGSAPAALLSHAGGADRLEPQDLEASAVQITPDGARVVFCIPQGDPMTRELYIVPIDASAAPLKVNGPLVTGGNVGNEQSPEFAITPDGSRVLYLANQDEEDMRELFATFIERGPRNGKAPVRTVFR